MVSEKDVNKLGKMTNQLTEAKNRWLEYILLPASTLFGILISLHNNDTHELYIRLLFALSILTLGLGILSNGIALYGLIDILKRSRKDYYNEIRDAHAKHRDAGDVTTNERKIFVFAEKFAYICFLTSVLLLSFYSLLKSFIN